MDISSGDIFPLVFRSVVREDAGEYSLDSQMLTILVSLDGKKNLGVLAKKMGLTMGTMRSAILKLLDLGLIEPAEDAQSKLDADFFKYMQNRLSLAIGPLAGILIEDAVDDLGHGMKGFPSYKAAELVNLIAEEIQKEGKRVTFIQEMLSKIKEKGYLP